MIRLQILARKQVDTPHADAEQNRLRHCVRPSLGKQMAFGASPNQTTIAAILEYSTRVSLFRHPPPRPSSLC